MSLNLRSWADKIANILSFGPPLHLESAVVI
jgi:hypothetical protein